jgi:arginine/lysine/ornithine decarboxylase
MKDYLRENTDKIKNIKGSSSIEDAYAYHNLGPGMGKAFMKADDNQPLSAVLPENVIKSNPKLYNYKTVGQAKAAMRKFLDERGDQANFAPNIQDLFKKEE